jgi:hypothetical protein
VINKPPKFLMRVRALLGVLTILFGGLSAPTVLALQTEENVCAMACCITEGHCCCKAKKAFVKGQPHDGKVNFTKAELAKPCSDNCATSSSTGKTVSRDALREAVIHRILFASPITSAQPPPLIQNRIAYASLSPRAPPV